MITCLIPARGGSKRVPRKNIRLFCGKPMIQWSIEAAIISGCFDSIVVSTEDDDIAEVAISKGADVPFRRPAILADDHATTVAVVRHALDTLDELGKSPTRLCCLYATAPFVQPKDLLSGLQLLQHADFAMPVTEYPYPIARALNLSGRSGNLTMISPEFYATRTQDLTPAFHDAGQFYWGSSIAWRSDKSFFSQHVAPIKLPRWRVQDIDTEEDWIQAETLFTLLEQPESRGLKDKMA